ncbi:hypothetical protein GCM10023332_19460 [Luteimonas vadosa]|uniref:Toxin CptA n=2 Tax=Luteimonas vadosa TaxID=1165507 RepID=A0ABP9E9Q6_9GAMM
MSALALMAPVASLCVLASEMPRPAAWPLAMVALAHGAWCAGRERGRPPVSFLFSGPGRTLVDGEAATDVAVRWRGPLAFVRWCDADGRVAHRSWWPDTLPPAARRELRLATARLHPAQRTPSMAP